MLPQSTPAGWRQGGQTLAKQQEIKNRIAGDTIVILHQSPLTTSAFGQLSARSARRRSPQAATIAFVSIFAPGDSP
ncbi:MAG TPA: hypothetical protein PK867_14925 [Pirellulales bacterium]|nr:hypothetical protein [Pirellulales bacterium]